MRGTLTRRLSAPFEGEVDARPLLLCRTIIALAALLRSSDALRPLMEFDHHRWVHGIEYAPWSEDVSLPRLAVGLWPGASLFLAPALASILVVLRTGSALTLLVGVRPRISALVLGCSGYLLMAADRFRYLHHLHLLWTSCLLLALVAWPPRRSTMAARVPRWSVALLRLHLLVVYAASGLAKLDAHWLDGSTLTRLIDGHLVSRAPLALANAQTLAVSVCVLELALVVLLSVSATRRLGIAMGVVFHLATAALMMVSIFPFVMIALLLCFWEQRGQPNPKRASSADAKTGALDAAAMVGGLLVRGEPRA